MQKNESEQILEQINEQISILKHSISLFKLPHSDAKRKESYTKNLETDLHELQDRIAQYFLSKDITY